MITTVIRALGTDVLAVQEILAPDGDTAAQRLRRLADDAGMHCEVPGPGGARDAALAFGGHGYHVGLMWRDGGAAGPGSVRWLRGRGVLRWLGGGRGTSSGPAACTMSPRLPAPTGTPRPVITRTTSTALTVYGGALTASG